MWVVGRSRVQTLTLLSALDAMSVARGFMTRLAEPRHQVIPNAKRIGHGGERRVHCSDAWKETGVDDVKVV